MDNYILLSFITFAGFIIGMGAVTVIDTLGYLAQRSVYYTQTTIRAHRVTKPLIWLGIVMAILGIVGLSIIENEFGKYYINFVIFIILIMNGIFLSFYISPKLLEIEKKGDDNKLIPSKIQKLVFISFIISFIGNWSNLYIFLTIFLKN